MSLSTVIELLVFFAIGATVIYIAMQIRKNTAFRLAIGMAVVAVFLVTWVNLAVGIVGQPDNPFNLLYFAVPAMAFAGALLVRFKPGGMSRVLFLTAFLQVLVMVVTLVAGWGTAGSWLWALLILNGVLTSMWTGSAMLFGKAALEPSS